jgi:membrane-bound lytic murein transglycosylase D
MLPVATDIRRIAEWIGTSVEKLQELNPELRRWTTPVRASNYALKVPEGTAAIVAEHLAQADPDELASLKRYTVKRGETLASIARALKVSRADLAEANYLPATARVAQGQQLIIPRPPSQLLAARPEATPAVAESRRPDRVVAASNVQASRSSRPEQSKTTYRVKRGDTLFSIAQAFDTSVASLRAWNRLRSNAIQTGQRLTIFTPRNATN